MVISTVLRHANDTEKQVFTTPVLPTAPLSFGPLAFLDQNGVQGEEEKSQPTAPPLSCVMDVISEDESSTSDRVVKEML